MFADAFSWFIFPEHSWRRHSSYLSNNPPSASAAAVFFPGCLLLLFFIATWMSLHAVHPVFLFCSTRLYSTERFPVILYIATAWQWWAVSNDKKAARILWCFRSSVSPFQSLLLPMPSKARTRLSVNYWAQAKVYPAVQCAWCARHRFLTFSYHREPEMRW